MNSDVMPDDSYQKPTDEDLADVLIYDEIIEAEREAAELDEAEHEIRQVKKNRSHSVD